MQILHMCSLWRAVGEEWGGGMCVGAGERGEGGKAVKRVAYQLRRLQSEMQMIRIFSHSLIHFRTGLTIPTSLIHLHFT